MLHGITCSCSSMLVTCYVDGCYTCCGMQAVSSAVARVSSTFWPSTPSTPEGACPAVGKAPMMGTSPSLVPLLGLVVMQAVVSAACMHHSIEGGCCDCWQLLPGGLGWLMQVWLLSDHPWSLYYRGPRLQARAVWWYAAAVVVNEDVAALHDSLHSVVCLCMSMYVLTPEHSACQPVRWSSQWTLSPSSTSVSLSQRSRLGVTSEFNTLVFHSWVVDGYAGARHWLAMALPGHCAAVSGNSNVAVGGATQNDINA